MSERPTAKPKYVLLQEFTSVLYRFNIIGVDKIPTDEYEAEALSILARFCEAALQITEDPDGAVTYAKAVIDQTFLHWFGGVQFEQDTKPLAMELLKLYIESYPVKPEPRVQPEVIG